MWLDPSSQYDAVSDEIGPFQRCTVAKEVFWKNSHDRKGSVEVIEEVLKPFNSYLYWWDNSWRIERYNDIS